MSSVASQIQRGMTIYDKDQNPIGKVLAVQDDTPGLDDLGIDPRNPEIDAQSGARILALGSLGGKGRDSTTDTDIAAGRGDVHTMHGRSEGAPPGTGGADALRGYSPPRSNVGDQGLHVAQPLATGELGAAGSSGGTSTINQSTEFARGPVSINTSGYLTVDAGAAAQTGAGGIQVPLSDVDRVEPGQGVFLRFTRDEVMRLYGGASQNFRNSDALTPHGPHVS